MRRLNNQVLVLCAAYRSVVAHPRCGGADSMLVYCRNMATAYNMEFEGCEGCANVDRRTLRAARMRHNVLSWMDEKHELEGAYICNYRFICGCFRCRHHKAFPK